MENNENSRPMKEEAVNAEQLHEEKLAQVSGGVTGEDNFSPLPCSRPSGSERPS